MKAKFLLVGVAVVAMACPAFADDATNLVQNGNFEEEVTLFEHDYTTNAVEMIPGWNRKKNTDGTDAAYSAEDFNNDGFDKWNAYGAIIQITDDDLDPAKGGDLITDDNMQYFRMQRYQWNGWFDSNGLKQTVDVTPGKEYSLECLYRVNKGGTRGTDEASKDTPLRYIRVYETADGFNLGALVFEESIAHETTGWIAYKTSGIKTDSETQLIICIGLNGAGGEGDGKSANENVWIDFDDVKFYEGLGGVNDLAADSNVAVHRMNGSILVVGAKAGELVEVFDLSGKKVAEGVTTGNDTYVGGNYAKGLYLVKVGNVAKKIVL